MTSFKRFLRETSGTAAVLVALTAIPAIGVTGLGIDYYSALASKAKLDAAADSAAIAAVTAVQDYITQNNTKVSEPSLTTNALAQGKIQANKAFLANAGALTGKLGVTSTAVVTKTAQTFSATVTYSGVQQTAFGKLFKVANFNVKGLAASSLGQSLYLDFYLALDMSGSMGLPTSTDGQKALMAINPDMRDQYKQGCQFACHFPGYKGYDLAQNRSITLRVDSVGKAVTNLINTATNSQTLSNQYRIGMYPFINNVMQAAALSNDYTNAKAVAAKLGSDYLDDGASSKNTRLMGSGGTHFENLFPSGPGGVNKYIKTYGDGTTAAKAKPFLFLVTDGMHNDQVYNNGNWTGSTPQRPTTMSAYCGFAKQAGLTVAILYIPYQAIYNPDPYFAGGEDITANNTIQYLPKDLQNCASQGFFFTANSDKDIDLAMQAMFAQAQRVARLTQ